MAFMEAPHGLGGAPITFQRTIIGGQAERFCAGGRFSEALHSAWLPSGGPVISLRLGCKNHISLREDHYLVVHPTLLWVITPLKNGISRVNPLITGVITHLLSGMSHQVEKPWLFCNPTVAANFGWSPSGRDWLRLKIQGRTAELQNSCIKFFIIFHH